MVSLTGSGARRAPGHGAGRRVDQVECTSSWGQVAELIPADADFERAVVDGIDDPMRNTGQVCGGLARMLFVGSA